MSDELFRIVVAAGVVLASIAFAVQAGIVFAMYRITRRTEAKALDFIGRVDPVFAKMGPLLDQAGPVIHKIGPVIDRVGPVVEKFGVAADSLPPIIQKAQSVIGQAGVIMQHVTELTVSANEVVATTHEIMLDSQPQLKEMSTEAAAIARIGRGQVERIGEVLDEARDLVRVRIHKIDQTVAATVDQVEHVGESVKSAVLRPVREVNGLAAGISAAVSTLVRGQRKSSVDAATQDEEMFI